MGYIRPATPGFIVTLVATALLAVVSFCVPYFKSVYFLKANISVQGVNGSITFGTLGYCLELSNGTTCSRPSVGYELGEYSIVSVDSPVLNLSHVDINSLVGNTLPIAIPQVAVKWLTYALVLHIVALGLAAGSAVFGLLAHVREMSMTCCSTCVSGFAAAVALLAFIFDIVLFFVAKARINAIGTAQIGNAIWLTLAAWILLFFSGCFFTLGRCCISRRKPRDGWDKRNGSESGPNDGDQLRLDAVKAEAERKKKQKMIEGGLPAFDEMQPLAARIEGDHVYLGNSYRDDSHGTYGGRPTHGGEYAGGGYVQAPAGSRAVDEYYSPTHTEYPTSSYPPASQHPSPQGGYAATAYTQAHTGHPQRQASGYAQSQYAQSISSASANQYNSTAPQQYGPDRYGSPQGFGHTAGGTSGKHLQIFLHSCSIVADPNAATSHIQQPTTYSQFDPLGSSQIRTATPYNVDSSSSFHSSPPMPTAGYAPNNTPYYPTQPTPLPDRSYTLGGGGYGENSALPLPDHSAAYFAPPGELRTSPPLINTNAGYVSPPHTSPVKGPRLQAQLSVRNDMDDQPPGYEIGTSSIQGAWGKR